MAHVFISYAHLDGDFISVLKQHLVEAEFDVWIDQELLRPGEDWRQEIDNAIKTSLSLITVMTPKAHESKYVTYEWAFALGLGIKVIPIMLEQTELHPRLDTFQYIDFTNHWSLPWNKLILRLKEIAGNLNKKEVEVPIFVQRSVDMLESYDSEDRETAIDRLTQSNHPSAVEALANAVQHHIDDVRPYAAVRLAEVTEFGRRHLLH